MTDRYDELRAAAESLTAGMAGFVRHSDFMRASGAYANLANPETVLALLSERDSLLAAQTIRPDRLAELGDFISGLFEWGADDPHDQADEIRKFLVSPVGLEAYRDAVLTATEG